MKELRPRKEEQGPQCVKPQRGQGELKLNKITIRFVQWFILSQLSPALGILTIPSVTRSDTM